MGVGNWSTTKLVVASLGIALAVFFAGACAAVAANAPVPTALWAAGGAVSGALVGLLAPAPGTRKRHEAAAAAATKIARRETEEASSARNATPPDQTRVLVATERADDASVQAQAHTMAALTTPETRLATSVLLLVFVVLLTLGIFLSGGGIVPPAPFTASLTNITAAIVALASAAGTALIGLLVPTKMDQ